MWLLLTVVSVSCTTGGDDGDDDGGNSPKDSGTTGVSKSKFVIISEDDGWCNGRKVYEYGQAELNFLNPKFCYYLDSQQNRGDTRFCIQGSEDITIVFRQRQYGCWLPVSFFKKGFDGFGQADVEILWNVMAKNHDGKVVSGSAKVTENTGKTITVCFNNYKSVVEYGKHIQELTLTGYLTFKVDDSGKDGLTNICPDNRHPHAVDMGSAGTWACCNIGAQAPAGYGYYYPWGVTTEAHEYLYYAHYIETEEREDYSDQPLLRLYPYYDAATGSVKDLGEDISGTQYDVARVKWGSAYSMPTPADFRKLLSECQQKTTSLNGTVGVMFTAGNGNKLFFPIATSRLYDVLIDGRYTVYNSQGDYWSSAITKYGAGNAVYLSLMSSDDKCAWLVDREGSYGTNVIYGMPVRAIVRGK